MQKFSERIGARSQPRNIQVEAIDDLLRNSLWNIIYLRFHSKFVGDEDHWESAAIYLASDHYKVPIDTLPEEYDGSRNWIRKRFFEEDWAGVYDILEFLANNVDEIKKPRGNIKYGYRPQQLSFLKELNQVLERELSGYRFIKGVLSPITDPVEVVAIEEATNHFANSALIAPSEHIRSALELLGKRPNPDYRNSVKESISAVEAAVRKIADTDAAGVAKALDRITAKFEMHTALKEAFKKLYGYTSNEDGIRHAIMDQATVGYDEAKFMLVACSAFVNFLIARADAAGILR